MSGLLATATNNLPMSMTSFIGRKRERETLTHLLSISRLVTITGATGSGKTRLSIETAHHLLSHYPDGVWLVELAPLADGALTAQTIASALDVREQGSRPIAEVLVDLLRPKSCLLLLDNCEHLLPGCARFVYALLTACPHLRILATSLVPLGIDGEVIWTLAPLPLPSSEDTLSVEQLLHYEAVALFLDRARTANLSFALTPRNAHHVEQICRRLDGLPLAIELAARRTKMLSIEELSLRLERRFDLLAGGSRTGLSRHQALRATIDWCHDLLTEPERTLWQRLSVFAGDFSLEAVEAICAGGSITADEVLDTFSQLIDKSIVAVSSRGETRSYRLLETIREYGKERLQASGEAQRWRNQHRDWYMSLVEQAEGELTGPHRCAWLQRVSHEYENIRAALQWCRESGEIEAGLRLAGSLYEFWNIKGHFREALWQLENLFTQAARGTAAWTKASSAAGVFYSRVGAYEQATNWHQQSLQAAVLLGDKRHMARSLHNLSIIAFWQSDYPTCQRHLEQSLALSRELQDLRFIAASLGALGSCCFDQGKHEQASTYYQESLSLFCKLGNQAWAAVTRGNVALSLAQLTGNYTAARQMFEESLERLRHLGDTHNSTGCLRGLAWMLRLEGDYGRSHIVAEECLSLLRMAGDKRNTAYALFELAVTLTHLQEVYRAAAMHRESLLLRWEIQHKSGIADSLEKIAGLMVIARQCERAIHLYGAASALRSRIGAPILPTERAAYHQWLAIVQEHLSPESFAREWAVGERLSLDLVVGMAQEWLTEIETRAEAPVDSSENRLPEGQVKVGEISFTAREADVIRLVAAGLSRKEIGDRLRLSPRTVQTHEENVRKKLNLASRVGLAAWAVENGLI